MVHEVCFCFGHLLSRLYMYWLIYSYVFEGFLRDRGDLPFLMYFADYCFCFTDVITLCLTQGSLDGPWWTFIMIASGPIRFCSLPGLLGVVPGGTARSQAIGGPSFVL